MKNIVVFTLIFINSILFCQTFTEINVGLAGAVDGSISWGDYDNDGDLDILLTGSPQSRIYRNDSGIFTDINAELITTQFGSSAWGDFDNDGDLDFILTGMYPDEEIIGLFYYESIIYRNDESIFKMHTGLTGVAWGSSVAWGDYDNDGDLDILLTGNTGLTSSTKITKLYRNDSGVFTDINADLEAVSGGSINWGDYDNDGDLDILLNGSSSDGKSYITKIYRNDLGIFTDINAGLIGLKDESSAWGDYDNDGDLDVLLSGNIDSNQLITILYRNDSGVFNEISAGFQEVSGLVKWGDYDNDGDLDILLFGGNLGGVNDYVKIYRNDSVIFSEVDLGITDFVWGSAIWGDYDNDGDLITVLNKYRQENIHSIFR